MQFGSRHTSKSGFKTLVVMLSFLSVLVVSGHSPTAFAQDSDLAANANSSEYYTIEESQEITANEPQEVNPLSPQNLFSLHTLAEKIRNIAFNLLRWKLHPEAPKKPLDRYNRRAHFGNGWINDRSDKQCYNTRAKVLIRDSTAPVSFKDHNTCIVATGEWSEPYTGETITEAGGIDGIQIDHMVPLKNAYTSGAWEWNFQTRCLYANFMGNNFHLISSSARENMRKGDRAPDQYMPPLKSYRCQYLENWLKIKLIWKLNLTSSEVQAVRDEVRTNNCDSSKFTLTARELKQQRKLIYENLKLCPSR